MHCSTKSTSGFTIKSEMTVLCFYCMMADKQKVLANENKNDKFSKSGFSNWKKVSHREAEDIVIKIPSTTREMLNIGHAREKAENRKILLLIISSILFLARQGLALQDHYKTSDNLDQRR